MTEPTQSLGQVHDGGARLRVAAFVVTAWVAWWLLNAAIWYHAYRPVVSVALALGTFGYWTVAWLVATPFIARWMAAWSGRTAITWRMVALFVAFVFGAALGQALLRAIIGPLFYPMPRSFAQDVLHQFLRWGDLHAATGAAVALMARAWVQRGVLRRLQARVLRAGTELNQVQRLYLQRQLRPHFLFNVLSTVADQAAAAGTSGHGGSTRAADRTLAQLESLLARAGELEGRELVPLRHELELLQPYLDLQRARFADSLEIEVDVDPATLDVPVPLLVIQPLVENAIHHGAGRRGRGGLVRVVARATRRGVRISVSDNGPGWRGAASRESHGLGLRISHARLAHIYGAAAALRIEESRNGGVRAVLELPGALTTALASGADDTRAERRIPVLRRLDATERDALRTLTWQMQGVWAGYGVVYFLWHNAFSLQFGPLRPGAALIPVYAIGLWLVLTPLLARGVALLQWRLAAHQPVITLLAHAMAAAMVGYLAMRVPLTLAGYGHLAVFRPGPLNTIAQHAMLYAVLAIRVHLEGGRVRERIAARERERLETELAAARAQAGDTALHPSQLRAEVARLRAALAAGIDAFDDALGQLVQSLRQHLNRAADEPAPLDDEVRALASLASSSGATVVLDASPGAMQSTVPAGILRRLAAPWLVRRDDAAAPAALEILAARSVDPAPGADLVVRSTRPRDPLAFLPEQIGRCRIEYQDAYQVHLFIPDVVTPPAPRAAREVAEV